MYNILYNHNHIGLHTLGRCNIDPKKTLLHLKLFKSCKQHEIGAETQVYCHLTIVLNICPNRNLGKLLDSQYWPSHSVLIFFTDLIHFYSEIQGLMCPSVFPIDQVEDVNAVQCSFSFTVKSICVVSNDLKVVGSNVKNGQQQCANVHFLLRSAKKCQLLATEFSNYGEQFTKYIYFYVFVKAFG